MSAEPQGWGIVDRDVEGRVASLQFTVPGAPQTWQRVRSKQGQFFTSPQARSKMGEVRDAWLSLQVPPFAKDVYLAMGVVAILPRPKAHYLPESKGGGVRDWALGLRPGRGQYGGDIDNFVKLVKDALNEVAYHDDSQIAEYLTPCGKWFVGDPVMDADEGMPRTLVTIEPVRPVSLAEVDGQPSLISSG